MGNKEHSSLHPKTVEPMENTLPQAGIFLDGEKPPTN